MFAKEINLEPIQISIFFSIMKKTHEVSMSSPYMRLDEDYAYFQNLILMHSIDRPPYSKKYFSLEQIRKITEYATNTYFRHYTMYKYTFTKQQKLTLNTVNVNNDPKIPEEEELKEEEVQQQDKNELENAEGNEEISILETNKTEKTENPEKVEDEKETENNKTEEIKKPENTENNEMTENIVDDAKTENESEEKKDDEHKEENEVEEREEELTPREKAIVDLKALIESAIGPKIQELKTTLTTMLSNSEDQLIKQIKKMDDAKKKASKEATTSKSNDKDKKASKGKKK
jgi:hypothetical protein